MRIDPVRKSEKLQRRRRAGRLSLCVGRRRYWGAPNRHGHACERGCDEQTLCHTGGFSTLLALALSQMSETFPCRRTASGRPRGNLFEEFFILLKGRAGFFRSLLAV
jgi:hypothetical protein